MNKHLTSKLLTLLLLLFFVACSNEESPWEEPSTGTETGHLTNVITETSFDKEDLATMVVNFVAGQGINLPVEFVTLLMRDVDVAAIEYSTTGVNGEPITASGVIAMPQGTTSYDHLVSIQHGTLNMEEAPSKQLFYYEMLPVICGHVIVMADYIGYGSSQTPDRQHPYLHDRLTGTACADMIEAAREYLKQKNLTETNDDIELMGYSQGGQASMATLFELERRGLTESVRAVYAGGDPYDLESILQTFLAYKDNPMPYERTGYAPYLIRGMVYGEQLEVSDENLYAPEVIEQGLNEMFSTRPLFEWHEALGTDITQVIHPDFFTAPTFNGNADVIAVIEALRKNSLINSSIEPQVPVYLYHSPQDDFVPYSNAVNAHQHWTTSTLTDLSMPGHVLGGVEFMLRYMGLWELVGPMLGMGS
ncbi:lipase family protein [Phocaeicola barnesiae]|uniref:lipase family protein n=1 Tax=Phocaeicola barnesiae TaxID=376804 RepID=UPI00266EF13B|nr:lipase family protein [Phocaeicola barnesiae]